MHIYPYFGKEGSDISKLKILEKTDMKELLSQTVQVQIKKN